MPAGRVAAAVHQSVVRAHRHQRRLGQACLASAPCSARSSGHSPHHGLGARSGVPVAVAAPRSSARAAPRRSSFSSAHIPNPSPASEATHTGSPATTRAASDAVRVSAARSPCWAWPMTAKQVPARSILGRCDRRAVSVARCPAAVASAPRRRGCSPRRAAGPAFRPPPPGPGRSSTRRSAAPQAARGAHAKPPDANRRRRARRRGAVTGQAYSASFRVRAVSRPCGAPQFGGGCGGHRGSLVSGDRRSESGPRQPTRSSTGTRTPTNRGLRRSRKPRDS